MEKQNRKTIRQELEVEVLDEVQVIVAGGGTAGCIAALAAAKNGADVLLVEKSGTLGGMLTTGNAGITMFTKFSGNPEKHKQDHAILETNPSEIQIAGGITMEIADRLIKSGAGIGSYGKAGSYVFSSSEKFKRLLFEMMCEAGVKLKLHSWVADVILEDITLKGIVIESKSGRQFIPAKIIIDTTGDGDIAARSGVPYTVGVTNDDLCAEKAKTGEMQHVGIMFKLGNTDLSMTFKWLEKNPDHFQMQSFARFSIDEAKAYFEKGEMSTFAVKTDSVPRHFQIYNQPDAGVVTICCPCVNDIDGCDTDDLTRAEIVMSKMVGRWIENMRKLPGFEKAFLLDCPEIGVRETRHIQCDHVLDIMDIYNQKVFKDCIGFGSHPIDTTPRPEWLNDPETAYPPRWYFQIPFSSLIAKGKDNLLIAGRCISATHEAFGCIRPTVQCMITGEAAGTAAALCLRDNTLPRKLNVGYLRKTLKSRGVLC